MVILALSGALDYDGNSNKSWTHGSNATLIVNNNLVGSCIEERFTRIKYDGNFPHHSISALLNKQKLCYKDVDVVCYVEEYSSYYTSSNPREYIEKFLKNKFVNATIEIMDHHIAHSYSSIYTSEFEDCNVLSMDGGGSVGNFNIDKETEICNWGFFGSFNKNNNYLEKNTNFFSHTNNHRSLGAFYNELSIFVLYKLGHKDYPYPTLDKGKIESCAGKVMGLSAYGNAYNVKAPKIFKVVESFGFPTIKAIYNFYTHTFRTIISQNSPEDIAAWAQMEFEDTVFEFIEKIPKNVKKDYLCFSGGSALNIILNTKLLTKGYYKDIHVAPAINDDGLSFGAALNMSKKYKTNIEIPKNIGCIGMDYEIKYDEKFPIIINEKQNNYSIFEVCDLFNISYNKFNYNQIYEFISNALCQNKIIGWYQGKSEFGPRALCNRSILANPTFDNKETLNQKVKHREWWRPYAAVVLEEYANEWFDLPKVNSYYMMFVGSIKSNKLNLIPSVSHKKNSCRIQTINENLNCQAYKLLKEFYKKTNVPLLLNTSFNTLRGEPIVETPLDALKSFYHSSLDFLVINDIIFEKNNVL